MKYDAELQFFMKLLKNLDISVYILTKDDDGGMTEKLDVYFKWNLGLSYSKIYERIAEICRPACFYHASDDIFCDYILFQLPDTEEPSYMLIGPYAKTNIKREAILERAGRLSLPPELFPQLEWFYMKAPVVSDTNGLCALMNTLGVAMWGSLDAFEGEDMETSINQIFPLTSRDGFDSVFEDTYVERQKMEKSYRGENEFLKAIELGQVHKADLFMKNYTVTRLEQRMSDSVRNVKNYSIILNTLLRKAAEKGGVHPIHIHKISSEYAKEIETLTSVDAALRLHKKMVHKYCLLVKNHSLKSYSPLIKNVLTNIDADLTTDLTLKAQAELLNVNASYLSALFKKEMGMTLTDYVNKSRVTHAITLLNTSNMQVQLIAQYCGISDVNYFTKLFKKYIGKTPQEYRKHISGQSDRV